MGVSSFFNPRITFSLSLISPFNLSILLLFISPLILTHNSSALQVSDTLGLSFSMYLSTSDEEALEWEAQNLKDLENLTERLAKRLKEKYYPSHDS